MIIGIPKEIKVGEYRVGGTPAMVRTLTNMGHQVYVQSGAGIGINSTDMTYQEKGAIIVDKTEDIFEKSDLIIKVKEPQPNECKMLSEGQTLFTYLHLAADKTQTELLLESKATAIAYELVTDQNNRFPLLAPMSEVAGRLSAQMAAMSLEKKNNGKGLLLCGIPGVKCANVTIIGAGVVGINAATVFMGMGANVSIFDKNIDRLRELDSIYGERLETFYPTSDNLDEKIAQADVVVGAVLVPGASAPKLLTSEHLKSMEKGSVIVDVAIDQGGCFETSKATTHQDPTYIEEGVVHYCVANMPGAVPMTSTYGLTNATQNFVYALANKGLNALKENPYLMAGLSVHNGKLTSKPVADNFNFEYTSSKNIFA